jgi:hypothetical protein
VTRHTAAARITAPLGVAIRRERRLTIIGGSLVGFARTGRRAAGRWFAG